MATPLFKYLPACSAEQVLGRSGLVTLKCGTPAAFNDPYELFLAIDLPSDPELLAFYEEVVGDLPQFPTTCFSKSPTVIPMWAHYARDAGGYVLQFDDTAVTTSVAKSQLEDVKYSDAPIGELRELLSRAYEIQKPRYSRMLRRAVFSAAYFTKLTPWAYEQERRLVLDPGETSTEDGKLLVSLPHDSLRTIVVGPRATRELKDRLAAASREMGCELLQMVIGRSSPIPFFFDSERNPLIFDGIEFDRPGHFCSTCLEPSPAGHDDCTWCRITDEHLDEAAIRNPLRLLGRLGLSETG